MNESLQDFVHSVNGTSHLRIEHDFGDGFVRLQTSEAERRQAAQDIRCSEDIVLEMLRNSRDARATHIFVALSREGVKRTITVIDDGCGIPSAMHDLVFEPRVTSKLDTSHMDAWGLHGRGMALFSIAQNAESASVLASAPDRGSSISVTSNLDKLGEKADQSTFPTFELSDSGTVNVRGPKNILRTVCEFAIESRATCSVFVGSPAEIAATLYAYGTSTLSAIDRLFCKDLEDVTVSKRLATTGDPQSFADLANALGLTLSERTARRILDGEIPDVDHMLDRISIARPADPTTKTKSKRSKGLPSAIKLDAEDVKLLASSIKEAFGEIAEGYYLERNVEPSVRTYRDKIVVSIPVVRDI